MRNSYDLIVGLCCYKSPEQTISLIRSADTMRGDILFYVTTVLEQDTHDIVNAPFAFRNDVKVTQCQRNSRYFCQNWGFIDTWKQGIKSMFWATMDDDTEFINSQDFIDQLYEANNVGFSVLGFTSTSHGYGGYKGYGDIGKYKNLAFVDGHAMFSCVQDNIQFGLCDQVGIGNTSYVEVEYCNKLKTLTGKPILANVDRTFIHHKFRTDPKFNELRVPFQNRDTTNGEELYRRKYGITITPGDVNGFSWETVINEMNNVSIEQRVKQFVFGELGPDWDKIYDTYNEEFINVL